MPHNLPTQGLIALYAKEILILCIYVTFKSMSVENRKTQAHSSNACFNCLHYGHSLKECKNTGRCKKCSKSHHTMNVT